MHVYATRLLLYLIAHPSLRLLMEHLSPAAPPSPVTPLPAQPTLFASRGGGAAPPFSLEGVLKSCEHTGYREADQPEGLALALKRYQLQALAWMVDMEDETLLPRGVNGLFWEVRPWAEAGTTTPVQLY